MKIDSKVIIGSILIFLGILFFLDTSGVLGYVNLNTWDVIGYLWPLVLLGFGIKLLSEKNNTGGIILVSLGLVFLLTKYFSWNFFSILWPMIIIAIGVSIIFKNEDTHINATEKYDDNEKISETAIFWGIDKKVNSKSFRKAEITAIFGGCKIDMREAVIDKKGAQIVANAAFGGVEILVPKDCKIVSDGTGFLGGWENSSKSRDVKEPVLRISGSAVFGGVEIKE